MCRTNLVLIYKKVKFLTTSATKIVTKRRSLSKIDLNLQIISVSAPTDGHRLNPKFTFGTYAKMVG